MESAYVNELVMIVAEREVGKVAVQIKDNVTVAANSGWSTSPDAAAIAAASAQVGAFALGAASADAAMIVSLAPGNYSAQVVGANGTAGIAIIEIYELP